MSLTARNGIPRGRSSRRRPSIQRPITHAAAFVAAAAVCLVVWALTGGGAFWPGPVLVLLGAILAIHALGAHLPHDYDHAEELAREARPSSRQRSQGVWWDP